MRTDAEEEIHHQFRAVVVVLRPAFPDGIAGFEKGEGFDGGRGCGWEVGCFCEGEIFFAGVDEEGQTLVEILEVGNDRCETSREGVQPLGAVRGVDYVLERDALSSVIFLYMRSVY